MTGGKEGNSAAATAAAAASLKLSWENGDKDHNPPNLGEGFGGFQSTFTYITLLDSKLLLRAVPIRNIVFVQFLVPLPELELLWWQGPSQCPHQTFSAQ